MEVRHPETPLITNTFITHDDRTDDLYAKLILCLPEFVDLIKRAESKYIEKRKRDEKQLQTDYDVAMYFLEIQDKHQWWFDTYPHR